jgi:hypothetical protein
MAAGRAAGEYGRNDGDQDGDDRSACNDGHDEEELALFGLSMDYEVFLLSRIREEFDRTGSTRAAIIEGLGRTGRLVTSAALILRKRA